MGLIEAHDLWTEIMMLPHNGDMISSEEVEKAIAEAPTVDAFPIVQGQLEQHTRISWRCNMCGRLHDLGSKTPEEAYMNCCSSCGAVFNMTAYMSMRKAIERKVDNIHTVDAVPVVHGRWERCGGDLHSSGYPVYCSVCNKVHFVHYKYSIGGLDCKELFEKPKYCPSCGAVMDIEE